MILETERLLLREMDYDDFGDIAEMLKNPKVMYAYEHSFSDDDIYAWIERQMKRYKEYGFGLWAMVLKPTGDVVGQAGITMQHYKDSEIPEIGYLLKERFWHHGYAVEAAFGCREYAFNVLGLRKVYSIIKTDNEPSMKVAASIGMRPEDSFTAYYYNGGVPHYLFSVESSGKLPC